ncbi:MAG: metallophosphoesterase [Chitinophagales bacterium]|nr:metallophosphoesterase [Chitinophagales bacterium]MCZ2393155.1 metallophosphoesterase [Chitinophagales bacterium]
MVTFLIIVFAIILLTDIYLFRGLKSLQPKRNWLWYLYFITSIFSYSIFIYYFSYGKEVVYLSPKIYLLGIAQSLIIAKIVALPFVLVTDILKGTHWSIRYMKKLPTEEKIKRYPSVLRIGFVFALIFFGIMIQGMTYGAYHIKKYNITITIPNLAKELKGLKIAQISDAHLGSFANTHSIEKVVQFINEEHVDIFVFTGDLVNDKAIESKIYIPIFKNIEAQYGKFSILGNHDYSPYIHWDSKEEQSKNLKSLIRYQKEMDWDVLLNENRLIDINGKKIAIIGVEYWGRSKRWGQYADMDKALKNTEKADLKILLTHDPTHWDRIISQDKKFQDIALTLSGHTHGFQFGVDIPGVKWSPSQYIYPRWAGVYLEDWQYLYVNRGLGFLGYPGRVGIFPEITIITLE